MTAIPRRLREFPAAPAPLALSVALLLVAQLPQTPAAQAAGTPTVAISSARLVADDGAFVFYGDSTASKDLPRGGWKKSRSDIFTLR